MKDNIKKIGRKLLRALKYCLIAVAILAFVFLAAKALILGHLRTFVSDPVKVDPDGKLYYMEYTGDYSSPFVTVPIDLVKPLRKTGCSGFYVKDTGGDPLTGRNFDFPHFDKEDNTTGLNVVLKCSPKDGYRSLATADAVWISLLGQPYYTGAFDNPKTDKAYAALLPYLCMDGVNEKGFAVSILYLDLKEGEHPVNQTEKGKESVILSVLLRQMLDHCATVEEAISLANDRNVINTFGGDFHLFVSDAEGDSAALEWRYDTLTVTRTDIVTNFYVGWDDAEDCYYDGELKEAFVAPEDPEGYHFGYGHGYERFKTIMDLTKEAESGMEPEEAMKILEAVSQEYTGELTSLTQYSVVYHNKTVEMDICAYPDYSEVYHFSL